MPKSFLLCGAVGLLVAGCVSTPPATQPPVGSGSGLTTADRVSAATAASAAWMALGTEPFWNVEVTQTRINYADADGRQIAVANPGAQPAAAGKTYTTNEIVIAITPQPCSDGMSDRIYADTVRVEAAGRSLQGCGGAVLPPTTLTNTNWRIVSIDGQVLPTSADRPASMRFTDNRVTASVGCNSMSGQYTSANNQLTVAEVAQTEMMCQGDNIMAREAHLSRLLQGPLSVHFNAREQLVLTAPNGGNVVLQRAH
jgi:heat shock protein HslJ